MPATWKFSSPPTDPLACRVLAFNGEDSLLTGYAFDLILSVSDVAAKDAPNLMQDLIRARLTLTGTRAKNQNFSWHGMPASLSYLFSDKETSLFRVLLRPRSYRLWLTAHSRIFLSMPLPQILSRVLTEEGFTANEDFESSLRANYAARLYTCQYNESSANFLLRHLERVGAWTFVRQKDGKDVLVLADGDAEPEKLPLRDDLDWSQTQADESVFSLFRTLAAVPTKITLRDYSTELPDNPTEKSAEDAKLVGGGEVSLYGGCNLYGEGEAASVAEQAEAAAEKLAAARVRALAAKAGRVEGESSIPWLRAGYAVSVDKESFQLLSVRHVCNLAENEFEERMLRRARQAGFIPGTAHGYRNAFTCHPLALGAYAPECETPRPAVPGLVHARVDAGGDGEYAELDEHGRYKVMFFFPEKVFYTDNGDPAEGNRSIPLRMAQAHAGESSGISFPLLKGVEVLVAFTDGDPDRPLIVSALPNPKYPSVVVDKNQQINMISTPGGHKISFTDTDGKEDLTMATPGGHKIVMNDEGGKRELRLQSPCGGNYIRIREM